jgi:hypothetical protein
MKKKLSIIGLSLLLAVTAAVALCACGGTPAETTKEIVYSEATNPYADFTWQQFGSFGNLTLNEVSSPIVYQFEGSYSEAYQGDYSREYIYLNCYEDGLLYGTLSGQNIYGYWTNRDRRDREQFVLHILRHGNSEYNNGDYDMLAEKIADEGDYYEYSSSFVWNRGWGIRSVLIFGYRYSPVKTIEVDTTEAKTEYILGENLSTEGIKLTITRENGKSTQLDNLTSLNGVRFLGFDNNVASDESKVTVRYRDKVTTYNVKVIAPEYTGKGKYNDEEVDVKLKVTSASECEVTFGEYTTKCKYVSRVVVGNNVSELVAPTEDDGFALDVTEEVWAGLHKSFVLDKENFSLNPFYVKVYEIPTYKDGVPNDRATFEPVKSNVPGGNTEQRFLYVDEEKGECQLTYKYWNGGSTDTFTMKYRMEGNKIIFTELVSSQNGGSGVRFDNLYKEFILEPDGEAYGAHLEKTWE